MEDYMEMLQTLSKTRQYPWEMYQPDFPYTADDWYGLEDGLTVS